MNLALTRIVRGDYPGAEGLLRRSLAISRKVYGPVHIKVANTLNNLGHTLAALGRDAEAIEVLRQAVPLLRRAAELPGSPFDPFATGTDEADQSALEQREQVGVAGDQQRSPGGDAAGPPPFEVAPQGFALTGGLERCPAALLDEVIEPLEPESSGGIDTSLSR